MEQSQRLITVLTYTRACVNIVFTVRQTLKCLISEISESKQLTRYMCCEGDEGYEAEHFGQLHVDSLTPVHHFSALDDGVQNVSVEIQA